jgi:hypothetical protein
MYFGTDVVMAAKPSFAASGLKTLKTSSVIGILVVGSALLSSVEGRKTVL